ncbi:MAG: DUF222 domain-containing protein [Nitriliruptoraceae bacterium]
MTPPVQRPALAREHGSDYTTAPPAAGSPADPAASRPAPTASTGDRPPHPVDDAAWRYLHDLDEPRPGEGEPPFGLPILAEIPGLATVLEQLREADRLIAQALEGILLLQDHADVHGSTGISLEGWVTTIARRTRTDARMLLAAADMVRRLPTLRAAFVEGRLSWAQVRAVALKARPLPPTLDEPVDEAIAAALEGAAGSEPDAVTRIISWTLSSLEQDQERREEKRAKEQEFLAMQPRLDGSGGRLWGEFSAGSWAILDAALGDLRGTRAGAETATGQGAEAGASGHGRPTDPTGKQRAQRLVRLLDGTLAGGSSDHADAASDTDGEALSRPQLLLRTDLATLLDRSATPGTLLTTLLGGHARLSATATRELLEARGADLRTVILDETGSVVGVGRRQRLAPDWLKDAVLSLHDTCSAPGCLEPARTCDIDHAAPWHPVHPGDLPGTTDAAQLAPVCARHNHRKERDGWIVEQRADGRRRWRHRRSGLQIGTVPATWRPTDDGYPPPPEPPVDAVPTDGIRREGPAPTGLDARP